MHYVALYKKCHPAAKSIVPTVPAWRRTPNTVSFSGSSSQSTSGYFFCMFPSVKRILDYFNYSRVLFTQMSQLHLTIFNPPLFTLVPNFEIAAQSR